MKLRWQVRRLRSQVAATPLPAIPDSSTVSFKIVSGVLKRDFFQGEEIFLNEKPVGYQVPGPGVKASIAYVTEDRKVDDLFETASIACNTQLDLLARFFLGARLVVTARKSIRWANVDRTSQNPSRRLA
jgi:ABC-type sugar transport system ATPase subunit